MLKNKIILVLLASLFATIQLKAQDDFSIGPRVGVNFSNVSNVDNSSTLTGLALGLTSTYSINEASGLTLDLLYSREGYSLEPNDIKYAYIQIPVYYDLFFGKLGEPFRPKIYIGLVPGFLIDAKVNDEEADKDQFSAMNFAFSGGMGFNVRAANRIWLNFDLRAYLGLNDIRDNANQSGSTIRNNNIQPSIGIAYGLTKLQ